MTISEQIEKLDRIPGCDWTGKEIEYALSIIRALSAPPTETETQAVRSAVRVRLQYLFGGNCPIPDGEAFMYATSECAASSLSEAAISAFLKGRGV